MKQDDTVFLRKLIDAIQIQYINAEDFESLKALSACLAITECFASIALIDCPKENLEATVDDILKHLKRGIVRSVGSFNKPQSEGQAS